MHMFRPIRTQRLALPRLLVSVGLLLAAAGLAVGTGRCLRFLVVGVCGRLLGLHAGRLLVPHSRLAVFLFEQRLLPVVRSEWG